jgi:3-hydroxyisobutyrate dehydrogenase-like beta-hydroxyacid dehydrogenase
MRIGFVGLGNMGIPMARNLIRAGHDLAVYNRTRSRADVLANDGARIADSPAQAAKGQEIVISMLANDAAVESTVLGANGIAEGLEPNRIHISMSTISPDLSSRLAKTHGDREQRYLAAPVFGRPEAAAAAKLYIVAAGRDEILAEVDSVFSALGQRTFNLGDRPEQANLVKIFGNFLIMCTLEGLGEVFTAARKADIDPKAVLQVLTGTLFGCPIYNNYGPILIEEKFSPPGFRMPLGLKDVRLMLDAAEALGTPIPFGNVIHDRFVSAIANGYGELDWSAMTLAIAQSAGLAPGSPRPQTEAAD